MVPQLDSVLNSLKVVAITAFTMAISMVGGQDAVKKSGEKVLGETTNVVFKSSVTAVVGQINKLPEKQREEIRKEICK